MWHEIKEKMEMFRDGQIGQDEFLATIDPWINQNVADRLDWTGYGSGREAFLIRIREKIIDFLKSDEAKTCEDVYEASKSIIKKYIRIRRSFISWPKVEGVLGEEDEAEDPNENEKNWMPETEEDLADMVDKVAADFQLWQSLRNIVNGRHGGIWDAMKVFEKDDPLWQVFSAFTSEHADAFALTAFLLAGKTIKFPSWKEIKETAAKHEAKSFLDLDGIGGLQGLTDYLNRKHGLLVSVSTVARWRKEPKLDLDKENEKLDCLLQNSKIIMAKKKQKNKTFCA